MKKSIKKNKVVTYIIIGVIFIVSIILAFLFLLQKSDKDYIQQLDAISQVKTYENDSLFKEGQKIIEKIKDKQSATKQIINFYKSWANYTYNLGNVDSSIIIMQKAIEANPHDVVLFTKYGFYLFHSGKEDMAVANWKKAIELDSTFTQSYVNLITYYFRSKFNIDSLSYYVNMLKKLDPEYPISKVVADTLKHFKKLN